ncbi:MAG TPA: hypothetical protein VJL84_04965 [Kiloniellales bacterium]|nr:hypothetical protein [Kiloniellales bacterium]
MGFSQRIAFFCSMLFVGLMLGPALAHLFSLPNKLPLDREDYFVTQAIYSGWQFIGVAVVGALASLLWLAVALRRQGPALLWILAALGCIVAAQAIFWAFTYPANVATANWTQIPDDWERLRDEWEYSHAVGAVLTLGALLSLAAVALRLIPRRS